MLLLGTLSCLFVIPVLLETTVQTLKSVADVNVQVKVADRSVFKTTDAEAKVAFPSLLQAAIDKEVGEYLQTSCRGVGICGRVEVHNWISNTLSQLEI